MWEHAAVAMATGYRGTTADIRGSHPKKWVRVDLVVAVFGEAGAGHDEVVNAASTWCRGSSYG